MKTLIFCVVVATCASNTIALHAEARSRSRLAASMFSGIQPGHDVVSFAYGGEGDINSSFAYGFGISYDGIALSQALTLILSSEVNFIRAETDPIDEQSGGSPEAQFRYRAIPILMWGELQQPGGFGPFLKLGIGAVHSAIDEEYHN